MVALELAVGIPVAMSALHKAHAGFAEASGHEALFGEGLGGVGVGAVEFFDVIRFAGNVLHAGDFHLHFEGEFVGRDARFEFAVGSALREVFFVEGSEQVEFLALLGAILKRVVDEGDFHLGCFAANAGAGVFRREEGGGPGARAAVAAGRIDGDEAGEVFVFAAETVVDPRAHRRAGEGVGAGVQFEKRTTVSGVGAMHRFHEAKVIDNGRDVGEEIANLGSALAVLLAGPGRF